VAHPVIGEEQRKYCGNKTTTTKYNLLTFIPKSLFEQYRWGLGILVALVLEEAVLCGVTCSIRCQKPSAWLSAAVAGAGAAGVWPTYTSLW
jgi:hypothetical protein